MPLQTEQKDCRLCTFKCVDEGVYIDVNDRRLNQAKAKGTRPERRLLRALRLILIAIPLWVLLLRLSPQSIAKCALSR